MRDTYHYMRSRINVLELSDKFVVSLNIVVFYGLAIAFKFLPLFSQMMMEL